MTSELLSSGLDKSLLSEETLRITPEGIQWVQKCLNAIEERSKQFQSKGMTKFNFVFGVSNSLIVAWSFGALPGYFWIVAWLFSALILLPIRWNNMIKRLPKEHLPPGRSYGKSLVPPVGHKLRFRYWLDFCWCANFVGVILLMALLFKDIDLHVQKWAFCAAWGLGNGPLLCAIAVLGNSLLFHDFDNTSSVLIHLFPSLVMYEMGWNREYVFEAFPKIFTQHGVFAWGVACQGLQGITFSMAFACGALTAAAVLQPVGTLQDWKKPEYLHGDKAIIMAPLSSMTHKNAVDLQAADEDFRQKKRAGRLAALPQQNALKTVNFKVLRVEQRQKKKKQAKDDAFGERHNAVQPTRAEAKEHGLLQLLHDTIFHHTMRGAGGAVVSKLLGFSPEEQKEMARGNSFTRGYAIWYLLLHAASVLFSIPVALLCFADKRVHIGLLGSMVLVTIYNASSRYTTLGVAASLVEFRFYMVSSYGQALRRELNIPLKRGASALIES
ncbi:unnamed protein product [Cladocopium goreaui]|uniref:Glycerophosphocholine acyltransferase 1 n=1 Tax=Cladocopium goreaui TaxID=2562237 RepID=A0A9P1FUK9_9DINO|nr:unnamed protein product [Cladocopium goreaui]